MTNPEEFQKMAAQIQSLYEYTFGPTGTTGFGQAERDKQARASISALEEVAHSTPCEASKAIKASMDKSLEAIFKRLRQLEVRFALYAGAAAGAGGAAGIGIGKLFGSW